MATETKKPGTGFGQDVHRVWGMALIKTGTEHLDLSMVRRGRQALKDAETRAADKPQED
jgi:hypothetical protein